MKNLLIALSEIADSIISINNSKLPNQFFIHLDKPFDINLSNSIINKFKELDDKHYLDMEEGLSPGEYIHQPINLINQLVKETICIEIKSNQEPILLGEIRKEISEIDQKAGTLLENLSNEISNFEDESQIEKLIEILDELQSKITSIQEKQGWI